MTIEHLEKKLETYEGMLAVAKEKKLPQTEMLRGKVLMLKELIEDEKTMGEMCI
jgi:hypothetical protein